MIEARKCARCGAMYISGTEVCGKCEQKDGADINKLKGFFEKKIGNMWSKIDISQETGITQKNLSRFLDYDEFKGLEVENNFVIATLKNENNGNDINNGNSNNDVGSQVEVLV